MADVKHIRGTTLRGNFNYNQPNGDAFDLTGYTVTMYIKQDCGEKIPMTVDDTDAATGVIAYHLHSGSSSTPPTLNSLNLEAGKEATWTIEIVSDTSYDDTRKYEVPVDVE